MRLPLRVYGTPYGNRHLDPKEFRFRPVGRTNTAILPFFGHCFREMDDFRSMRSSSFEQSGQGKIQLGRGCGLGLAALAGG